MTGKAADILMYHSISSAGGPTSIALDVFSAQMAALAASDATVVSLDEIAGAFEGGEELPPQAVVLTFDDGFQDFADAAWPLIREQGWPVTVFLPTGHVGRVEGWRGIAEPPRPLMNWKVIAKLAAEGVDFGAHSVSHPDLTAMEPEIREAELTRSQNEIAQHLGRAPLHFAPPYGLSDAALRKMIAQHFRSSCGTRLGRADASSDLFDLPRLEMFYYTDISRWRAHLAGRGGPYLALRKTLRGAKNAVLNPWAAV